MTAYSNIINKAVETAMAGDGFNARTLAPTVYDRISRVDRKRTASRQSPATFGRRPTLWPRAQ